MFSFLKFVIRFLPFTLAYKLIKYLAERSPPNAVSESEAVLLNTAKKIHYGDGGIAWCWGEGPVVLCVHGWGGAAGNMAPMAIAIAKRGFRVIAIDITAHGSSAGKHVCFRYFSRDIKALLEVVDESLYALVGHSAGALAMMASRYLEGVEAKKYVCISAPKQPYPPLKVIRKKLAPSDRLMESYQGHLARQFEHSWEDIPKAVYQHDDRAELVVIHDDGDKFVDCRDAELIHSLWPGSVLHKTNQYSHRDIVYADDIIDQVSDFLLGDEQGVAVNSVVGNR